MHPLALDKDVIAETALTTRWVDSQKIIESEINLALHEHHRARAAFLSLPTPEPFNADEYLWREHIHHYVDQAEAA